MVVISPTHTLLHCINNGLFPKGRAVLNFQQEFFRRWRPAERQPDGLSSEEAELMKPLVRTRDEDMVLFTAQKSSVSY